MQRGKKSDVPTAGVRGARHRMSDVRVQHGRRGRGAGRGLPASATDARGSGATARPHRRGATADHAAALSTITT